jgi:hypothetical protein
MKSGRGDPDAPAIKIIPARQLSLTPMARRFERRDRVGGRGLGKCRPGLRHFALAGRGIFFGVAMLSEGGGVNQLFGRTP